MKPMTLSGIQIPLRWPVSGSEQHKYKGSILCCSGDFSGRVQVLEIKNNWKRRENKTLEAREKEISFKDTAIFFKEPVQIVFPF